MPLPSCSRILLLAAAMAGSGCASSSGSASGDDSGDAPEMKPHPRRTEMPSLLGPGSARLKSGMFPVIPFDDGAGDFPPAAQGTIAAVARYLKGNPERVVLAAGAETGPPEYARQLSDRRAGAVRGALIRAGVPASKILSVAFGQDARDLTRGSVAFFLIGTGETP